MLTINKTEPWWTMSNLTGHCLPWSQQIIAARMTLRLAPHVDVYHCITQAESSRPARAGSGRVAAAGKDYKERSAFRDKPSNHTAAVAEGPTAATELEAIQALSQLNGAPAESSAAGGFRFACSVVYMCKRCSVYLIPESITAVHIGMYPAGCHGLNESFVDRPSPPPPPPQPPISLLLQGRSFCCSS